MGDGVHAHELMDNYISHEHGFAEASGTPAHIDEMRKPHPMQHVVDAVSVKVLRGGTVTDDEWAALVENARRGSEGDWPETRQTLNTLGRLVGREVE